MSEYLAKYSSGITRTNTLKGAREVALVLE